MSDPAQQRPPATAAFDELRQNLEYARGLIKGGRLLERLDVRAFEIADLYRAAWVQAVAALDHWVHNEMYDRAVALAEQTSADRPTKFLQIDIPMELFENVHHHEKTLGDAFREHLRGRYGWVSYQHPDNIKQAFQLITDRPLWPSVAKRLSGDGPAMDQQEVKAQLLAVVQRRHKIAHEADRDPQGPKGRRAISDADAIAAIDLIERVTAAMLHALGPVPVVNQDPVDAVEKAAASEVIERAGAKWSRAEVDLAIAAVLDDLARWALEQLLAHADTHDGLFRGGVGPAPSAGLYYWLGGARRSLWSLYIRPGRPAIALSFGTVATADEGLAQQVVADLRKVPSIDAALLEPDEVAARRYPEFDLATLVQSPEAIGAICDVLTRVIDPGRGWR